MLCRLQDCLSCHSLQLLAAAVPSGCSQLTWLDLSHNTLVAQQHRASAKTAVASCSSTSNSDAADRAWAGCITALSEPACRQLRVLQVSSCPELGPAAAAALSQLLRVQDMPGLQQLHLGQSCMAEVRDMNFMASWPQPPSTLAVVDVVAVNVCVCTCLCRSHYKCCELVMLLQHRVERRPGSASVCMCASDPNQQGKQAACMHCRSNALWSKARC